jgi:hypothetical protein
MLHRVLNLDRVCNVGPHESVLFTRNWGLISAVLKWVLHVVLTGEMGTAVAQWLRCCATNRKVTGSIPGGVNLQEIWGLRWHSG